MISIDPRAGSSKLIPLLLARGLPVEAAELYFADAAWAGKDRDGNPVSCGLEYKTLGDALNCLTNGRFAGHQLPGLQDSYHIVYLLVEGRWKPGPNGELQVYRWGRWVSAEGGGRAGWKYSQVDKWLENMSIQAGVRVLRAADVEETVQMVHDRYAYWCEGLDLHTSHLKWSDLPFAGPVSWYRPTVGEAMAKCLPGVGEDKARAAMEHFKSIKKMVNGSVEEWMEIEGVGKKIAERVVKELAK